MAVRLDPVPKGSPKYETGLALKILARISVASKQYPVKYQALADEFGVDWRKIADVVEQLRDAGHKVASVNGTPPGCFIAKSPAEMAPTALRLEIQGKRIIQRARKLMDFGNMERTLFDSAAEIKFESEFDETML